MLTNPIASALPTATTDPVVRLLGGGGQIRNVGDNLAGQTLVQLSQLAARPAFELQFNITQNQALARLDAKIQELQDTPVSNGRTALLKVRVAGYERGIQEARDFKDLVATNRQTSSDTVAFLTELRALADSSSVAEFDAKRDEILAALDKLRTATGNRLGAPDGLAQIKADATAALEGLQHNNFASAADVQAALDTIDELSERLNVSLSIQTLNQGLADTRIRSQSRSLSDLEQRITDIEVNDRKAKIDEINALRDQTSRILTSVSLAFEGSQSLSGFVAQAVLPQSIEPGSVLNLFA